MNKRLLIIFGVVVVLFVPFVAFLVTQQPSQVAKVTVNNSGNSAQSQSSDGGGNYNGSSSTGNTTPSVVPTNAPEALTADESALKFYKYYNAAPHNPLANGAYKDSIYLAQDFKDVIRDLYKNGDTPVFCPQNQRPNVVVGQDRQVYSDGGYLTQVVISDATAGKGLYRMELQNLTGSWLVYDINCIR